MILKIEKIKTTNKVVSKLGKTHDRITTRTVYYLKCDICGRLMTRSKAEAYKIEFRSIHACSNECVGKYTTDKRWEGHVPRLARRKTGYMYMGKRREHQMVAEKDLGRALKPAERVHHINGDKGNNIVANLYVCESIKEHNRIHGQLEALAFLLVQKGDILFCKSCGLYYLVETNCICGSSFGIGDVKEGC